MIGSGPFKIQEYRQSEFVHLVANREYWGTQAKVDAVVFQTFENQDALVQAIKTGQVDMITEMPNTAIASLRNAENVQVVTGAPLSPDISDIAFNLILPENCPTADGGVCSGHPALQDRNVRLALAHATDKIKLIDVVLLGLGDPGLTLVARQYGAFFNSDLEDYTYDVALANQILEDAGYKDTDGDGVREDAEGRPLNFRLNYPSDSTTAPREAELLSEMWSEIGVTVEIQPLDGDALTAVCCPAFDYDIFIWGWGGDPDPGFQLSIYLGSEIPSGLNETGYSNPVYDELYTQQATELDPDARRAIIWEMQRIVLEDVVYIIPWYGQSVQAFRTDRFQGWIIDQVKVALEDPSSLLMVEAVPAATP
jgi:peptide/nickel transport system substrate-binding protein